MPSPTSPSPDKRGPYRTRALELAHHIRDGWQTSRDQDIKSLVDDVQSAFAEEANHELRQVLFQLSAQLELALVKGRAGEAVLTKAEIMRMLGAVGRATNVVEAYLDRGEAAKMVIDLDLEWFDLGAALEELLRWNGLDPQAPYTDIRIAPCTVQGDRRHLMDVLGHMATRFYLARAGDEHLRVRVRDEGGYVSGFFGLVGARLSTQELMAEFEEPLEMDDMQIDMPYTRAVIERHGGALYVAADADNASGFGFNLPKHQTGEE